MNERSHLIPDWTSGKILWRELPEEAFRLMVSGDFCPTDRGDPGLRVNLSPDGIADLLPELARKDLSIINLEAPLTLAQTPIVKSGPNLKVDPARMDLLRAGQWDVACCANNHMGDFGPAAVRETLETLRGNGIETVGAGNRLEEARRPLEIERRGLRIAVLAFAENEFGMAGRGTAGANPLDPLRNLSEIREASSSADLTLVLVHGGNEFNPVPSPRVVQLYRAFADAGASAVVGGHTHCAQGIEIWKGVPIVYSLGNFFFPSASAYGGFDWWPGLTVRISFAAGGAAALEVIPHSARPPGDVLRRMRGASREHFLRHLTVLSSILADDVEIGKYYDAWCLSTAEGYFARLCRGLAPADWTREDRVREWVAMRNLHTCEAHNELLTRTLKIFTEHREREASDY
ncbi:MAG: CapA family protein, partial [Kiritimatiellia bacterium]|nr:CapA family protein [Kiritimatiellia bacterium]